MLEQDFVKDKDVSIAKLVGDGGATLTRFAQVVIGR